MAHRIHVGHGQIAPSTAFLGVPAAQLGYRPRYAEHSVLYSVVRELLDAVLGTAGTAFISAIRLSPASSWRQILTLPAPTPAALDRPRLRAHDPCRSPNGADWR